MSSNNSQDPHCPICFTYYSTETSGPVILHCGSSCCQECILEWLVTKISTSQQILIPCISSACRETLKVEEISSQLTIEFQTKLNEELFKAYLNNQEDIRRCPRENCQYAGVITPKPCGKELQCGLCSTTWTDKIQQTKAHKIVGYFKQFSSVKNDILSGLWKLIFSKKCPGCKSSIERDEGCEHITCLKCGEEFCWNCPYKYPEHDETLHKGYSVLWWIVVLTIIVFIMSILYIIPPVRFILDWTVVPVCRYTMSWIIWIKNIIVWAFWISRDFFLFNWIVMGFGHSFIGKKATILGRIAGFLMGCFFCYIIYYFEIVWPVIKFGLYECLVAFLISMGEKAFNRLKPTPKKIE